MEPIQIKPNIYWVGVIDWELRHFHGYTFTTKRGSTYNAYLILDDHVTLVDAVYGPFAEEMLKRIREIVPLEKIENIIVNHVETDHSGALPQLLKYLPNAKLYGTQKCQEGLEKHYYGHWNFQVVKSGDVLNLGKKTLRFIEASMIHWPDSMFTYCPEEQLLLPNDAFGQHLASNERYDDEVSQDVLWDEMAKYYANILWPYSPLIAKKIEEIEALSIPIDMIAPSHGIIWRKNLQDAINAYKYWSQNGTKPKVVIAYETMWGATAAMAGKIEAGIRDTGLEVTVFDVNQTDKTQIMTELLDAKGFLFGSSTHDNSMLSTMAGVLHFLQGLRPKNRLGAAFGSYGWAGGAVQSIESVLTESGIVLAQSGIGFQYKPSETELQQCYEWGKSFAERIKA